MFHFSLELKTWRSKRVSSCFLTTPSSVRFLRFPRRNWPFPVSPAVNRPDLVVVLPDPFRGMAGVEKLHGDQTVRPRPKVWTIGRLLCHGYSLLLSSYLCRTKRKNSCTRADTLCRIQLTSWIVSYLSLSGATCSILDLWSRPYGVALLLGTPWNSSTPPSLGGGPVASPPKWSGAQRCVNSARNQDTANACETYSQGLLSVLNNASTGPTFSLIENKKAYSNL